jgi:hypothetical protein
MPGVRIPILENINLVARPHATRSQVGKY